MHRKLPFILSVALGAAMLVAPTLSNLGSDSIYDSAFAAKGGNGKGNGGGNGNGNGNGNGGGGVNGASASGGIGNNGNGNGSGASASLTASGKTKTKSMTSQMGALNAAHASAQAFANPNPNSRVGRIKEAVLAQYAVVAAETAALTDATALEATLATGLGDAWNPDMTPEQFETEVAAIAVTDAALADELRTAYGDWQTAVQADADLAAAQATADTAWAAAANKPMAPGVIEATMALVGNKVPAPEPTTVVPTP
jgi:hypothetical protein